MEWEKKKRLFFLLVGIQIGVPAIYYSIFKFVGGGTFALVANIAAGNLVALLFVNAIVKVERWVRDARKAIALAFAGYMLADLVLVAGVIMRSVPLIVFSNVIAAPFDMLFWKNVDYYPIAVEGFTNRAKIVNQRVFWSSLGAAIGVFLFSVIPVSIYTAVLVTFAARFCVMALLTIAPPALTGDSRPVSLKGVLPRECIVLVIAFAMITYASQLYSGSVSVYQKLYFGDFFVPFISAVMFLVFGFTQHLVMRYFTSGNNLGLKSIMLLAPVGGAVFVGIRLPYVILGQTLLSAMFLSVRHLIIKSVPSERTGAVIMTGQIIFSLSAVLMLPFAVFGTPKIMLEASIVFGLLGAGLVFLFHDSAVARR